PPQLDPGQPLCVRVRQLPPGHPARHGRNRRAARRTRAPWRSLARGRPAPGPCAMSAVRWSVLAALAIALAAIGYVRITTHGDTQGLQDDLAEANAALQAGDRTRAAAIARD